MAYRHPDITPEMRARFRAQDRASDRQVYGIMGSALVFGLLVAALYFGLMVGIPWANGCEVRWNTLTPDCPEIMATMTVASVSLDHRDRLVMCDELWWPTCARAWSEAGPYGDPDSIRPGDPDTVRVGDVIEYDAAMDSGWFHRIVTRGDGS